MIEPISSMRNAVRLARKSHAHLLDKPASTVELLRKPFLYKAGVEPLSSNYLNELIERNILGKNDGTENGDFITYVNACDSRALFNSLSSDYQTKFLREVKAFDIALNEDENKIRNRKMIEEGEIDIKAGSIKVTSTSGPTNLINTVLKLLGVKIKNSHGVSAGGFQAAGLAFEAPNCLVIANTVDTDFYHTTLRRKALKKWLNEIMRQAYCFNTGKNENEVGNVMTGEHLSEMGNNLQVSVGEFVRFIPPRLETYFLPEELDTRFGKDPKNFELATAIAATANLIMLFFYPWDLTHGNCFIKDKDGFNHYLLDPGILNGNMIPLNRLEREIEKYKKGESQYPPFSIIIGNKVAQIPKQGLPSKLLDRLVDVYDSITSIDSLERVKKIGVERSYIEAFCGVDDPLNGNSAVINTRDLAVSTSVREAINCANIPTCNFTPPTYNGQECKSAIDQIYDNFVDDEYVDYEGEKGLSPFDLYLRDIDKAIGKSEEPLTPNSSEGSRSVFSARLIGQAAAL